MEKKKTLRAVTGFDVIRIPKKVTRLKMRMYGTCRGYTSTSSGLYDGHFDYTYDITVGDDPVLIRSYPYSYDHPAYTANGTGIYLSWIWIDEQSQVRLPLIKKYSIEYEYYLLRGGVVVEDSGGVQKIEMDNVSKPIDIFSQDEIVRPQQRTIPDLGLGVPMHQTYDERTTGNDFYRFVWSGERKYKPIVDPLQPYTLIVDMDLLKYDELEESEE